MNKLFYYFAFTLLSLGGISCGGNSVVSTSKINTISELETQFKNPSKEYRTVPFMVWNAETTKADIDFMIEDFKAKGIGGFFIHPRAGMVTEYLSEEWWDLCKYTVNRAKELGMDAWLYDENAFPSGMAGGHVQDQMPESYNQGHSLSMVTMSTLALDSAEYTVILKKEGDKFVNITETAAQEVGNTGDYYLFKKMYMPTSPRYGGFPYVNMMMPGVTDKFIEITMPGYEKSVGAEFGKTVPGIFTDEPHIRPEVGATWFTDLFEVFEKRWGYKLEENLPSLFTEVGEWRKIRHNYRQLLMYEKIERWSKPWRRYCDSTGLKWTGHYWEHAWPNPHVTPDDMMMYTFHDVPAIDILFNEYNEVPANAQFGNIRSVREVKSIANQMGRPQTLCEIYAGSGWELSFFDMKRQGDWVNVLGINTITQHYTPVTIKGVRKTDYPQVFSYHEPWWPYYGALTEYHARMTTAVSAGDQVNDILVIEPSTSAWMYYIRGENKVGYKIGEIGNGFQKFVTMLETNQVEYDLGSENVMKEYSSVKDKKMVVGKRAYSTVVIPETMENINESTLALLKEFAEKGGKIVVFGNAPLYIEGIEDARIAEFFGNDKNVTRIDSLTRTVIGENFLNTNIIKFAENIADNGRLFHQRRIMDDGQMLLLTNSADSVRISGSVSIKGKDALLFDPMTGNVTDYPETATDNGMIDINYDLYPAGEMVLYIADKKLSGYSPTPVWNDMKPIAKTSPVTSTRDSENIFVMDFCDVEIEGMTRKNMFTFDADNFVYETYGFKVGNPWFFSSQFKTEFLDHKFPANSGFTTTYHFNIGEDFDYSKLKTVVERAENWTIKVNGNTVTPNKGEWWVDMAWGVANIGDYVRKGENTITLSVAPMNIHSETMAVYLLGDFSVNANSKGWTLGKPKSLEQGSWKEQGLPFYSQTATYSTTFTAEEGKTHYEVELGAWRGTVAEVLVNGVSAGIIGWEPYRCDISELVKSGDNKVEVKVVGSLKNTLGPFYSKPRGQVSPGLVKRGPKTTPVVPADYDLFDYGLMGDINILAN